MSATLMWAITALVCAVLAVALQVINYRRLREYRGTEANHHHSRAGRSARLSGPPNATALGAPPGEGADPRLDLPVEYRDDAILAWKVARVVWHRGKWWFSGVTVPSFYDADDRAQCQGSGMVLTWSSGKPSVGGYGPRHHEAPDPTCSCGFYAMTEPPPPSSLDPASFVLRVELTGRVIECEHGYRAQRQRVLEVVPPRCGWNYLQAERCLSTATSVTAENGGGMAWPWCPEHAIEATAPPTPLDDVFASLAVEQHRGPDA